MHWCCCYGAGGACAGEGVSCWRCGSQQFGGCGAQKGLLVHSPGNLGMRGQSFRMRGGVSEA